MLLLSVSSILLYFCCKVLSAVKIHGKYVVSYRYLL